MLLFGEAAESFRGKGECRGNRLQELQYAELVTIIGKRLVTLTLRFSMELITDVSAREYPRGSGGTRPLLLTNKQRGRNECNSERTEEEGDEKTTTENERREVK